MTEIRTAVYSQLIPIQGVNLVLPNTCIAEIIAFNQPEAIADTPNWLLGKVEWRGLKIPVLSYEILSGGDLSDLSKRSRIIVVNALSKELGYHFYGLVTQGIPRLMGLDASNTRDAIDQGDDAEFVLRQVQVDGNSAVIPDQDALEKQLQRLKLN